MMSARLMRTRLLTLAAAAIATVAATAVHAQQPATPASTLPNGAASVNETYGDWTVDCRLLDHDDPGSNRSRIMNVIDSNILRRGMRAENRCALFLIPL